MPFHKASKPLHFPGILQIDAKFITAYRRGHIVSKFPETRWAKPELVKLGTLKDVAGGPAPGIDTRGNAQGVKAPVS